jgi:hypothetical protein
VFDDDPSVPFGAIDDERLRARTFLLQKTSTGGRMKAKIKAARIGVHGKICWGNADRYPFIAAQSQSPTPWDLKLTTY